VKRVFQVVPTRGSFASAVQPLAWILESISTQIPYSGISILVKPFPVDFLSARDSGVPCSSVVCEEAV